ncbi:hypothetical protein HRED_03944, partial [Candidatus Haloredivivus sp. G17]
EGFNTNDQAPEASSSDVGEIALKDIFLLYCLFYSLYHLLWHRLMILTIVGVLAKMGHQVVLIRVIILSL